MLEKAINEIVAEEFREEALKLVNLAPKIRLDELIQFYKEGNGNLFCSCLDIIKYDLYKCDKIKITDFPNFGEPFISFEN